MGFAAEPAGVGVRGTKRVHLGRRTSWIDDTEEGLGRGQQCVGEETEEPEDEDEAGEAVNPPLGRVVGEVRWL